MESLLEEKCPQPREEEGQEKEKGGERRRERRKEASKEARRKEKGVGGKVLSWEYKPMEEVTVPGPLGQNNQSRQREDLGSVWKLLKGY